MDERCAVVIDGAQCEYRASHKHHIQRRSQGGSNDPENLLAVCAGPGTPDHHGFIHANPAWSYEHGYLKRTEAAS